MSEPEKSSPEKLTAARNGAGQNSSNETNGSDDRELNLDLTRQEKHRGARAGDTYVRVVRPHGHLFKKVAPGVLRATEEATEPRTPARQALAKLRRVLIGEPLPNAAESTERLTKIKALAIFASDAMSSVAYATEEILLILVVAGASGALGYVVPISFAIALLVAAVAFSETRTIYAYPSGGGSYIVARENLGSISGLVAAAALTLDYTLTVAVSIAAGTAAVTSAFEVLIPYRVPIALFFIGVMVVGNLRGVRESGNIFAIPTYIFIFTLGGLIVTGIVRIVLGLPPVESPEGQADLVGGEVLTLWILMRAFSSGSVAASGIEAIANGVPAFKQPESKNAARTLIVMAFILGGFFLGISFLANQYALVPSEQETITSQLGRLVFGSGPLYLLLQFATMTILVLAANTAFNGFPRLAYILAQDNFMPHQFAYRGDRLAFSYGIIVLGVAAAVLIVVFNAHTHALIPLYAVGVFLAFTLSQAGMVMYWRKHRPPGWWRNLIINGAGACLTGIVLVIGATTKFLGGAWLTIAMIPLLVYVFWRIHRYYARVKARLRISENAKVAPTVKQIVIVPLAELNLASQRALAFARGLGTKVIAVHIADELHRADELREALKRFDPDVKLAIVESPYRVVLEPLLNYIEALHHQDPEAFVTVVVPEYIATHWWERILHNGMAGRLNHALQPHPNVAVVNVPYVLEY